jgi:hypothetical protein
MREKNERRIDTENERKMVMGLGVGEGMQDGGMERERAEISFIAFFQI